MPPYTNRIFSSILIIVSVIVLVSFQGPIATDKAKIAIQMESTIKTMLSKWYPQSVDKQYGGFLSTFTFDFKPTEPQDKMIVTQSRHIWSNAKASQLYPNLSQQYKANAKHGFLFLRNVMWDKQYGGFYTLVDQQGNVKKGSFAPKDAYGNAFAIYGLAAYYQASGDTSALHLAQKTFKWLEKNSHDPVHKGYYQHLERNGQPIKRETQQVASTSDLGYKDQNSSIHLLEAFTELYQVWPDPLVHERLQEMLYLIRDTITIPKGYLTLFLTADWKPINFQDSSEATILKHRYLDHVSFGHDVETAYLMLEASHVLGIKDDQKTMSVAKRMVDHALQHGWDKDKGGFYDEGYYFKNKPDITITKDSKNWWAQAEGLNSLLLMADHFPQDEQQYLKKFETLWQYADKYLIDHEHGDWFQGGLDKEPNQKTALKGQIWKANYHQFRAMANCLHRLRPDKIAPTTPKNLSLSMINNKVILKWIKATDNQNLLGYDIYAKEKKIGFTPLTSFVITEPNQVKGSKLYVKVVDLQGNYSTPSNFINY